MTRNKLFFSAAVALAMPRPFETGNGPSWKMNGDAPEFRDGNPVYIDATGKEAVFELSHLNRLNGEARSHRERADALAKQMKAFEGLDPEAARAALQFQQDNADKELIDKGEVEKVRNAVSGEWSKKLTAEQERVKSLESQIQSLVTDNAFASSKFVKENIAIPSDMMQAAFARFFKYEDGKLVAYGRDGNKLYSAKNPNAEIDFDEAIEMLVAEYPNRDQILKAPDHSGGGGSGGGNRGNRGAVMRRAEFEKLSPMEQGRRAQEINAGKLTLVD